jgi:hypothetical protein
VGSEDPPTDSWLVQAEIAASLVRALQLELKSANQLLKQGTLHSTEAYDTYLRGYHPHDQYSPAGLDGAVVEFRRALELDPTFLPAAERHLSGAIHATSRFCAR